MAVSKNKLIADWIQYLKNNKIAALKSDPKSGKLSYNRPTTSEDVAKFLEVSGEFSDDEIDNAIDTQLTKKGNANAPKQIGHDPDSVSDVNYRDKPSSPAAPQNAQQKQIPGTVNQPKLPHDPNGVTDVDYRETPFGAPKQLSAPSAPPAPKGRAQGGGKIKGEVSQSPGAIRRRTARAAKRGVNEDIVDIRGEEFSEADVEAVFSMLASQASDQQKPQQATTSHGKQPSSPEADLAKKQQDLKSIKRVIRDTMTDNQRKALWRILNEPSDLTESEINTADAKEIFKVASGMRSKPSMGSRLFKRLRKDTVDVNDLQQAWKDEGFPDDTRDIAHILKSHGFSDKEIQKVFSQVFGEDEDGEIDEPGATSPALKKIADYIKANGLDKEVIDFMKEEYQFAESFKSHKAVIEDIRRIFTSIVHEERAGRFGIIDSINRVQLGRGRK